MDQGDVIQPVGPGANRRAARLQHDAELAQMPPVGDAVHEVQRHPDALPVAGNPRDYRAALAQQAKRGIRQGLLEFDLQRLGVTGRRIAANPEFQMIEGRSVEVGQGDAPAKIAGDVRGETVMKMQRPAVIWPRPGFQPIPDPAGLIARFGGPAAHRSAEVGRAVGSLEILQDQRYSSKGRSTGAEKQTAEQDKAEAEKSGHELRLPGFLE